MEQEKIYPIPVLGTSMILYHFKVGNKRLDVVGWGNESNVDQWEDNGGNDNQKWIIKKNNRGNYSS